MTTAIESRGVSVLEKRLIPGSPAGIVEVCPGELKAIFVDADTFVKDLQLSIAELDAF